MNESDLEGEESVPLETIEERIAKYRNRMRTIRWVGFGLLAELLIYVVAVFVFKQADGQLGSLAVAVIPTCFLFASFSAAFSHLRFEWKVEYLETSKQLEIIEPTDHVLELDTAIRRRMTWPSMAELFLVWEIFLTVLAGLALLYLIWAPIIL